MMVRTVSTLQDADKQCVSDLDSNLERCGGCDGPDCTTLPNVDVSRASFQLICIQADPVGSSVYSRQMPE